tara:strand:- start:1136 stop:1306 length:171 start_codon:yes stop_codon:yes gene_type:complete
MEELQRNSSISTALDYHICEQWGICIDELDEISLEKVETLREDIFNKSPEEWAIFA